MQLNGFDIVDRHNRPTVIQRVALRAFFINDGEYYDPYDISGVTVFKKADNTSPDSVLDNNLIKTDIDSSLIVAQFGVSSHPTPGGSLNPTNYSPIDVSSLSGVYRVKQGEFVCVLDGTQEQRGLYSYNGSNIHIINSASTVNDYIDIWTVKFNEGSDYQALINDFHLYNDTFFTITQPLIFTSRNRLVNKHLTLSSIENLKITTEITVANKDIDESIKNIFKDSAITNAMVEVQKVNEGSVALPAHVTVVSYEDTRATVDITSDNTILWRFDTTTLATHPNVASFGGIVGTYRVTAKYNLLNETVITVPYYFTIN